MRRSSQALLALAVAALAAAPAHAQEPPPRYYSAEPPPDEAPPDEAPPDEAPPDEEVEPIPYEGEGGSQRGPDQVKRERTTPFPQGKVRVGIGGGLFSGRDRTDFGFEISIGVFVIDNLELGVDTAFQFGDSPFAAYLGPTARYVFPVNSYVAPYIGGFYRHWFLSEGFEDFDSLGARLGLLVRSGAAYLYLGIVYEAVVSECDGDCDEFYPEFGVSYFF